MKQLGLSASETAIIYGAMPFLGAFVRPFVGMIADKFHKHKFILMLCCLFSGVFHGCLLFVPAVPVNPHASLVSRSVGVTCERDTSLVSHCTQRRLSPEWMEGCPVGVFNTSDVPTDLDPFSNSSSCVLQCELALSEGANTGFCFTPMSGTNSGNRRDCSVNVDLEEGGAAHMEFLLDRMNHSVSEQTLDKDNIWRVCHNYAMSAFLYNGSSYQRLYCLEPTALECRIKCEDSKMNTPQRLEEIRLSLGCASRTKPDETKPYSNTFWIFLIINFLANVAFAPMFSLIDAMAYDFLGEKRTKWGEQRAWGTVGYAIFGVTAGLSMDLYSSHEKQGLSDAEDLFAVDYTLAFVMFIALQICVTIVVSRYKTTDTLTCAQMFDNIWDLLSRLEVVSLLILVFVFGGLSGIIETFVFWHLHNLGASQLLLGLCTTVSCLPEIPILFLSGRIIKKLGHVPCLCIACVGFIARFTGYSLLKSPWPVLAIEPLQGITFGLMYSAASSYGSCITPSGMHGTVQGLIGGIHFGIGKFMKFFLIMSEGASVS